MDTSPTWTIIIIQNNIYLELVIVQFALRKVIKLLYRHYFYESFADCRRLQLIKYGFYESVRPDMFPRFLHSVLFADVSYMQNMYRPMVITQIELKTAWLFRLCHSAWVKVPNFVKVSSIQQPFIFIYITAIPYSQWQHSP